MPDAATLLDLAARILFYLAALLLIGQAAAAAFGVVAPASARSVAALAAASLAFYALGLVAANARLGGGLDGAFDGATFRWVWMAHKAQALALAASGLLAVAAAAGRSRSGLLLAALGLSAAFGLSGHTRALEPAGIYPWLVAVHVLLAGFWLAAPATLWPRASLATGEIARRVERYGAVALIAVPALVAAGLALAWRLAGGPDGLAGTVYGRLLLGKLAVAAAALLVGALNKFWIATRLASGDDGGRRALKLTLAIDQALFLTALGLVGWATTVAGTDRL